MNMKPAAAAIVAVVVVVLVALGYCSSTTLTSVVAYEDPGRTGCNVHAFPSVEPWAEAKSHLLKDLIANTYSQPNSRYWTNYAAGGITYLYGYASCAVTMLCLGGQDYCDTTYDACSACLDQANIYLYTACDGKIGGHVTEITDVLQCYAQFEKVRFW